MFPEWEHLPEFLFFHSFQRKDEGKHKKTVLCCPFQWWSSSYVGVTASLTLPYSLALKTCLILEPAYLKYI